MEDLSSLGSQSKLIIGLVTKAIEVILIVLLFLPSR